MGFLEIGRPTVGWSKTAIFSAFGRYIFGTVNDTANIVHMVIYNSSLAFR